MKTNNQKIPLASLGAALGATLLLTVGCSTTYQTRGDAGVSPFLANPEQLHKGKEGEAKLIYVNPKADFSSYSKIQLEPVKLVAGGTKANTFTKMSHEDRQAVVNFIDAQIREKLGHDYAFVTEPGPGVMTLRVAVTEAKGSTVVLDTLSSVLPPAVAISAIKRLATGTHTAVGKAGAEMELKDSVSGERLAAAVDERAGRKYTLRLDKFKRYHTVDSAFDYWTTRLQTRLAQLRAQKPTN